MELFEFLSLFIYFKIKFFKLIDFLKAGSFMTYFYFYLKSKNIKFD